MVNNIKKLYLEYVSYGLHHVSEVSARKYEVNSCGKIIITFEGVNESVIEKKRYHLDKEEINELFNKLLYEYEVLNWMEEQRGGISCDGPGAWKLSLTTDGGIKIDRRVIQVFPHLIEYIEKDICKLVDMNSFDGCDHCNNYKNYEEDEDSEVG